MKKLIFSLFMLLTASLLFSQSLKDNPDYRESVRYKGLAEAAIEEGEYKQAKEYAELSAEYARKSDEYVAFMLAKYRANSLLQRAASLQGQVERSGRIQEDPAVFAEAKALITAAGEFYSNDDFTLSADNSRTAIAMLEETFGGPRAQTGSVSGLPASYLVRKIPGNEDCFWRIAGYDFVYDNAAGWKPIYEANRSKLPEPGNPDLILPGMVLDIPSRPGETRSGVWVDGEIRASYP